jgi:hypothetical protein
MFRLLSGTVIGPGRVGMVELSSPQPWVQAMTGAARTQPASGVTAGAAARPANERPLEARKERREAQVEQSVLLMS